MPASHLGLQKSSGTSDRDAPDPLSGPASWSSVSQGNGESGAPPLHPPLSTKNTHDTEPRSNLLGAIGGLLQSSTLSRPSTNMPSSPPEVPAPPNSSPGILSSNYALNFVFKEFETIADKKMTVILNMKVESEVNLPKLIGIGVDPAFDKVIRSLALLATSQQKPVIDAIMRWRKSKIEPLDHGLIKRVSESLPLSRTREVPSVLKERQSLASVYILCRALIEIVKGFTSDILPDDLGENLEEIVFNQLKRPDPDAIKRSKNRTASMDLFAELIGELSNIRFASVSDRFIAELEKYKSQTIMKERQSHMEMLVRGMRFLKIKIYPVDALEETADFLSSCASFFKNAHGTKVKHAYARLFVQLLLPIAEVTVAEVNFPAWVKAVDLMYPRAQRMTLKPRHIMAGYPLLTTLLCVSRKEFFTNNWLSVVESCYQKLNTKDRLVRQLALGCISRLTWTYLFRCSESTSATFKKLDGIVKTIFPPSRRAINPAETALDHFILIIYFALMKDVDTAMEKVVYYLLKTESTSTTLHWEYINPERVIVALCAFRRMLADLERSVMKPPFPTSPDMSESGIPISSSADVFSRPIRAVKADVMERVEEIISKTLTSLDETFGKLLVLDEKNIIQRATGSTSAMSALGTNYSVPIFSNSVGISTTSDSGLQIIHQYPTFCVSYAKDRQAYFDVIKVILDSMPRLMPAGIPLPKLIEMLSRYTVHVDPEVIQAASQALLRIAAQIDSQTVVAGYSRFVYRIEDKHCDIMTSLAIGPSTGGGPSINAGVMKLYVDLLAIWVDQIDLAPLKDLEREASTSRTVNVNTDMQRLFAMIEETEGNGLLFLCSQAPTIRQSAIHVIRLARELQDKLSALLQHEMKESTGNSDTTHAILVAELNDLLSKKCQYRRMFDMMASVGQDLIKLDKENSMLFGTQISMDTRTRIQQHQKRGASQVLLQIAENDHPNDQAIWDIVYPELFKMCFVHFPGTVALCRQNICTRLVQIQPAILAAIESIKASTTGTLSMAKSNNANQRATSPEMIEQWKVYLIFVCSTATLADSRGSTSAWANSRRKGSAAADKIATPRDLFRMVLQFLTCEHRQIREGAIQGLGNVSTETYKTLMLELQSQVRTILDDGKQRNNQKPYQNKRSKKNDRLRISLMHVLKLTAECLCEREYLEDKDLMTIITSYIKETKSFLADPEVQLEWEYHKLRVYLCGLVERLYENIMRLEDPTSIMSFETRLSLYKMFEEWCGYGIYANVSRTREATMMQDVLDQCKDTRERTSMTQLMEEEQKALGTASLSAMAMLCRGPLYAFLGQKKARQAVIQFDMLNVLRWIDAVFESDDPRYHTIARHALESILEYNQDQTMLLDDIIEQCYAGNPKLEFTQSYFLALAGIVTRNEGYPCHIRQIMSLALFKTGDMKKSIRKAAIQLLRVVEERVFLDSCAKEYEIGITSSLPAIYKHTQSLLSARLALDHPEQTLPFLSEITLRFEHISSNSQREVLSYMLPWLRKVDLTVGPQDTELSMSAMLVLSNLFYSTIKFGDTYVREIAALWHQLADHGRNVRAIIMYLLDMGLEKRNPWLLVHAKRVLVCLGRTPAFNLVVEEVIAEISPRSMVPQLKEVSTHASDECESLFIADPEKVLPPYSKRPVFSRGQLAMVYLVDLAIESGADLAPHLPLLLHSIFVHLDHLTSIVCDQSRCLLINLIHSIVIRQCPDTESTREPMQVIHWLSSKEGKRLWAYENITPKNRQLQSANELKDLIQKVINVFSRQDTDLRQKWGETALKWATCCSVRHIACRSFQCFRALMPAFNQHMLADMLARLSNTIADRSDEIRGFALEIILTLTDVARSMTRDQMEQFPQLFWAAVACLYGPYESEHAEALELLEVVLDRYGFSCELAESFPKNWSSEFDGLQPLLLKGLQFSSAEEKTFAILSRLMLDDNAQLIDPSKTRLLYLLLGCLPRLLHGLEEREGEGESEGGPDAASSFTSPLLLASNLAQLCERYALLDTQRALATYPKQKAKFQEEYLKQILTTIAGVYLTDDGQQALEFAILLVKNKLPYYRDKALLLVENLLPFAAAGAAGRRATLSEAALEPLLRLVQTEHVDQALHILNLGMIVTSAHDTPSRHEELLLTVSDPAGASQMTRHNVHAVVFECSSITNEKPIEHNIQFSIEDFSGVLGEEEELAGQAGHARSLVGLEGVGRGALLGDGLYHGEGLMNTLKDLDDFFNEDVETLTSSNTLTSLHANTGMEESNEESGNEESS